MAQGLYDKLRTIDLRHSTQQFFDVARIDKNLAHFYTLADAALQKTNAINEAVFCLAQRLSDVACAESNQWPPAFQCRDHDLTCAADWQGLARYPMSPKSPVA